MKRQYKDMGVRIQSRRKELKMTQGQLAEKVGISNNHMSSIETGKETPSLDTFVKICEGLSTRPDYLLLGSISSNNVSQSIIENLHLCSERDLELVKMITNSMLELNANNRNIE